MRHVEILESARDQSECGRRQIGAACLDADGAVLSIGWNSVRNGSACERCPLSRDRVDHGADYMAEGQYCPAVHAEEAALLRAGRTHGVRMLITDVPCYRCADMLHRFGIPWQVVDLDTLVDAELRDARIAV